jgi:amino-acid N-acetyltransferase
VVRIAAEVDMRVRSATNDDLSQLKTLLTASELPVDGVAEHLTDFLVAEDDGHIRGVIGLERYGSHALLRSAAVASSVRGTGVGGRLVNRILERAKSTGVEDLYLLTTTAEKYFPRFGFEETTRAEVPTSVQQSVEFHGACPDTAIVMRRSLSS